MWCEWILTIKWLIEWNPHRYYDLIEKKNESLAFESMCHLKILAANQLIFVKCTEHTSNCESSESKVTCNYFLSLELFPCEWNWWKGLAYILNGVFFAIGYIVVHFGRHPTGNWLRSKILNQTRHRSFAYFFLFVFVKFVFISVVVALPKGTLPHVCMIDVFLYYTLKKISWTRKLSETIKWSVSSFSNVYVEKLCIRLYYG